MGRTMRNIVASPPMIRMPGQDRGGAVELLQHQDADQLVRPGGGTEGYPQGGLVVQAWRQAVGTADREDHGGPVVAAEFGQPGGEAGAVEILAGGIEQRDRGALRDDVGER